MDAAKLAIVEVSRRTREDLCALAELFGHQVLLELPNYDDAIPRLNGSNFDLDAIVVGVTSVCQVVEARVFINEVHRTRPNTPIIGFGINEKDFQTAAVFISRESYTGFELDAAIDTVCDVDNPAPVEQA